jgi:methyl-accepting chemotaxis protein
VKAVKQGSELTQSTQDAFKENIDIAGKHARLIDEIAIASREQAQGITQVAATVVQMNQVTQTNAANAEESASASQELNAQVEQLKSMIQELTAIAGNSNGDHHEPDRVANPPRHFVESQPHRAAGLFHPETRESQAQVTTCTDAQRQRRTRKAVESKRTEKKDPKEIIPFHEDKEDDEKILSKF